MSEPDEKIVEGLRKSKQIIGPLRPCIVDQHGNLRAGKHRKLADPDWPETVKQIKDELEGELITIHDNFQRRVAVEETTARLVRVAELLEQTHKVGPQKICAMVCKLVPYDDSWVRLLLPPKYKQEYEKTRLLPNSHKPVKKFDRVALSREIAGHLKKLEEQGKIRIKEPLESDDYREIIEMAEKPLPYPDCACKHCQHYTSCYEK